MRLGLIVGWFSLLVGAVNAQTVINYSLHPDFNLPELTQSDIDRELIQGEQTYELICNVDIRRVNYPNGVQFSSGWAWVDNKRVALGLAYPQTNKIIIHNGTRNGGRTDYWRLSPGLLGAVFAHELYHIISRSVGHSADNNCIMSPNMAVYRFCPAEISYLQKRFGLPKLLASGTVDIPAANVLFKYGVGGLQTGLVGLFNGRDWGVCVYEPATSTFFIRYSLTPGNAEAICQFGSPNNGYQPICGDWDFDGDWTVGLYDSKTSRFLLKNDLTSGKADKDFIYGKPDSQALNGLLGTYKR